MAKFLTKTFRSINLNESGPAPPIVQPGQTLPRINTSRTISPLVVREEDDVTVSVEVSGNPSPKVTWYIGKATVTPSVEYQMKERGKVHYLTILNASEELDEGLFVVASNLVGRARKRIDVKLYRVLSKHKKKPRRHHTLHEYKSTEALVARRRQTLSAYHRYKSFGSFGQFDTLIDGDPDDEVLEDLDEKLDQIFLRQHKSTPNINYLPSSNSKTNSRSSEGHRYSNTNYTNGCQTLPRKLQNGLNSSVSRFLAKSTEAICKELTLPSIPSVTMEFGGFTPHQGSASIPLRDEEGNISVSDMDFFRQYNRNAQGSVSTFLPQDDVDNIHQMRPSATSSFHEQSPTQENREAMWGMGEEKLTSYVQDSLHDYHPDNVQVRTPPNPSMSQGYMSYDSSVNQSMLDASGGARRQSPYGSAHEENVIAGNLSQQPSQVKHYPKISAKPKIKTKKPRKKSRDVDSQSAPSNTSGVVEQDPGGPTYENLSSLQSPNQQVQGGYQPDQNSSAILYAPDGTMFRLPMNGEFNPSLVLGAPADRESTTSHSEQHSFAIMPNESINLSHGDNTQHALSVFSEDIDTQVPAKKKVVKKVKKRTKSTDIDTGVATTWEDITTTSNINVSARGPEDHLNLSRGSCENRSLPPVPREHEPQNVYEDIHIPTVEYQQMEYSSTNKTVDHSLPLVSPPQHLELHSSSHSQQADPRGELNTSRIGEPTYSPTCAQGNRSLLGFDQDNRSFSAQSGSSMQSLPVSPGSITKTKKGVVKRTRIKKDYEQTSPLSSNVDIMGGHYLPMDGRGPVAGMEASIYEDVHVPGGRRPTGPPPPPPTCYLSSPPSEEPPPIPTSSLPSSPQLTSQPSLLAHIQDTDIDISLPMTTAIIPPSQDNSIGLDYSIPAVTGDGAPRSSVRKTSHRKLEEPAPVTDGSSLPKKPKVAKKPKHLKQKLNEDTEVVPNVFQQEQTDTRENVQQVPHCELPLETNIDDVFQPDSTNVQPNMELYTSRERKTRRVKKKSRSRDFLEQNVPLQEIWIDGMPESRIVNELSTGAPLQYQDEPVPTYDITGYPAASTPKPTKKKKKVSRTASDNSVSSYPGDLQVVDIDISTKEDQPLTVTPSYHETDIDAQMEIPEEVGIDSASLMEFAAADIPIVKKLKVVKKKKKIAKSIGDISELRGQDLTIVPIGPLETDIDGLLMSTEGVVDEADTPKKKMGKKKKKLNKSTGDITAQLTNEVVNIAIDDIPGEDAKPKKKKKKKLAKSVGDLSQTLPSGFDMVPIDDYVPPDSFYEVQTLERPAKKVKKVKKKRTKSMGDLTTEETSQITVIDINIDEGSTPRETCVDDIAPDNVGTTEVRKVKKKKKKVAKSLSDDLLLNGTSNETRHISRETCIDDIMPDTGHISRETCIDDIMPDTGLISRETCIDDIMPGTTYIDQADLPPHDYTTETAIDNVPAVPTQRTDTVSLFDEHVYANIPGQTDSPAPSPNQDMEYDQTQRQNINFDGMMIGQNEPMQTEPMQGSRIAYENPQEDVMLCDISVGAPNVQDNVIQVTQPLNVRDDEVQMDFEPGPLQEPEYMNISQVNQSEHLNNMPSVPHHIDFTGEMISSGPTLMDTSPMTQSYEYKTELDGSPQKNTFDARDTVIDDVFVGMQLTSSPNDMQHVKTVIADTPQETPKKKKKRSKSADRANILNIPYRDPEASLEIKKVKKKKKLNKSTGDLTAADVVLVDIDIDGPPRSVSVGEQDIDLPTDPIKPKKVRKVKKLTKSVDDISGTRITDEMSMDAINVDMSPMTLDITAPNSEKKKKKKTVKKMNKSTGDIHLISGDLVPVRETNVDNIMLETTELPRGTDTKMAMEEVESTNTRKRKVKKKLPKSTSQIMSDVPPMATNGTNLNENRNLPNQVLQEYFEEEMPKSLVQTIKPIVNYEDHVSPVTDQSHDANDNVVVDLLPVEASVDIDNDDAMASTLHATTPETEKGKKLKKKKKSIKVHNELTGASPIDAKSEQEIGIASLSPPPSPNVNEVRSIIDDTLVSNAKKQQRLARKKPKFISEGNMSYGIEMTPALETNIDDLQNDGATAPEVQCLIQGEQLSDNFPPTIALPSADDQVAVPFDTPVPAEKKKVRKKSRVKSVDAPSDVQFLTELPNQQQHVDDLLIDEMHVPMIVTTEQLPNHMTDEITSPSKVLPFMGDEGTITGGYQVVEGTPRKKIVKKKTRVKSVDCLLDSGSTQDNINIDVPTTVQTTYGYMLPELEAAECPVIKKKKKKVVKKKINKSMSDLSDLPGSEIGLTRVIPIDDVETRRQDVDVASFENTEFIPKNKKKVAKKKRTKSVGDLSNIATPLVTTEIKIEGVQDDINLVSPDSNIPSENTADDIITEVEPIQDTVSDPIPSIQTHVDDVVCDSKLQFPNSERTGNLQEIDNSELELKGTASHETITTYPQSSIGVDDMFLDQKTMSTVLGDVLMMPIANTNHSQEPDKLEAIADATDRSQFSKDSSVGDIVMQEPQHSPSTVQIQHTDKAIILLPVSGEMTKKKKVVKKKKPNKSTSDTAEVDVSITSQHFDIGDVPMLALEDRQAPIIQSATLGREKKKATKKNKLNKSVSDITDTNQEIFITDAINTNPIPFDLRDIPLIDDDNDNVQQGSAQQKIKKKKITKKKSVHEVQMLDEHQHPSKTAGEQNLDVQNQQRESSDVWTVPQIMDLTHISPPGTSERKVVKKKSELSELKTNEPNNNEVIDMPKQHTVELSIGDSQFHDNTTKSKDVSKTKTLADTFAEQSQEFTTIVDKDLAIDQTLEVRPSMISRKPEEPRLNEAGQIVDFPKTMPYIPPQPTPSRVDRKKEYTPVKYKPWTDILFSPTESKIKVTKKESHPHDANYDSSFEISVDGLVDTTLSSINKSTDNEADTILPLSHVVRKPVRQTESGVSLERVPSLRKETKSLENLVDAADAEVNSYSLQTYNVYDEEQEERRQERLRTKSVDNLTLLQQRQRLAVIDKSMGHKREQSKSTGCLLEGRLGKLWRKTLTQEMLCETTTTREEVIIIKRPTARPSPKQQSKNIESPAEGEDSNKKERRYVGSLMIVDIYDDTNNEDDKGTKSDDENDDLNFQRVDVSIETVSDTDKSDDVLNVSQTRVAAAKTPPVTTEDNLQETNTIEHSKQLVEKTQVDIGVTTTNGTIVPVREHEKPAQENMSVLLVEATQLPANIQTIHLETLGVIEGSEVKPSILMESPVVISTDSYVVPTDVKENKVSQITLEENDINLSKDEGIQVCLGDIISQRSRSVTDDDDKDDDSSDTETDGDSGESYDAADDNWDEQPHVDQPLEHHIDPVLDAIDEEESDADSQDNTSECLHTTTITITDEITTIESSVADTHVTTGIGLVGSGYTESDSAQQYITTAHLSSLPEVQTTHEYLPSTTSTNDSQNMNDIKSVTCNTHHNIESEIPVITLTKSKDTLIEEELESSIVCSESDSSQEEVDVIPSSGEGGFTESWEEVVTYEYEFDKDTGVKRIVLKPKILEVADKQIFQSVDATVSSPVRPRQVKNSSNMVEMEGDSLVVYEYGEMISMYGDTSNADIYLNNNLELGTSGVEGACAGVERAIGIMVSQEVKNAIDDVSGHSKLDHNKEKSVMDSEVADSDNFNEEPLPIDRQYAATFSQSISEDPTCEQSGSSSTAGTNSSIATRSDLEIDLSQMTPNLKHAVELLRHKYNLAKMSREATPIPPELTDARQLPEGYIINNDSLPESASMHIDDEIMGQVQEELETVLDELSKMEQFKSTDFPNKGDSDDASVERKTKRSESNSSEADTLIGTSTDIAQTELLEDSDDDEDDTSGEQMIFGMDDVFVKVVTTKDGRIKKIKILEGKEGGDTKKILSPQLADAQSTDVQGPSNEGEPAMFQDQRYFTRQFYQDDFFAGDDQYQSGSESDDQDSVIEVTEQKTPAPQYAVGDEIDVIQNSQQVYSDGIEYHGEFQGAETVRRSPEYTRVVPGPTYHGMQYFDGDHIHDDSTDSETSEDEDDDDDDYYEGDERESPMRSLSPIAEEAEAQSTCGSVPILPPPTRQHVSDSSEDDEEGAASPQEKQGKYRSHVTQRHSESDDDDLEILKELVRTDQSNPISVRDRNEDGDTQKTDDQNPISRETRKSDIKSSSRTPTAHIHTQDSHRSDQTETIYLEGASDGRPRDVRPRDTSQRDVSPVDSEGDILSQKFALEGFLSSLGMALFLILAAIIFHMIRQYMGDEM